MGPNKSAAPDPRHMIRSIVGCKWSLHVLGEVRRDNRRPGRIRASIEGLSTKVMNERLRKLLRYGLIGRKVFPEVPPRVEYRLTPRGRSFCKILDQIEKL